MMKRNYFIICLIIILPKTHPLHSEEKLTMKIQLGHSAPVTAVAYSPDGRFIISGGRDSTCILWDANTGMEIRTFLGHSSWINSVAFTPGGMEFLSGANNGSMILWNIKTGEIIKKYDDIKSSVDSISLSQDGKHILSGYGDGSIRLWDLEKGEILRTIKTTRGFTIVALSPDGKHALSSSMNRSIILWNIKTGEKIRTFNVDSNIDAIAFHPEGKTFVSGLWDGTVLIRDITTGKALHTLKEHSSRITAVDYSADGNYMLSGSADGTLRLWNGLSGELIRTMFGHKVIHNNGNNQFGITSAAFSPDGNNAVTGGWDTTARIWDLFGRNEKYIFSGSGGRKETSILICSPDGKTVLTGDYGGTIKVRDISNWSEIRSLKGDSKGILAFDISPSGKHVLSGSGDASLMLWDIQKGKLAHRFKEHTNSVTSVAFFNSGKYAVSGSSDGTIFLWDLNEKKKIKTFSSSGGRVTSLDVSYDGEYILSVHDNETVLLWSVGSGKSERNFTEKDAHIVKAEFIPRDNSFALVSQRHITVKNYKMNGNDKIFNPPGLSAIKAAAISCNGKQLAAGLSNGTVAEWDIRSGAIIKTIKHPSTRISSLTYTPIQSNIIITYSNSDYLEYAVSVIDSEKDYTNNSFPDLPIHDFMLPMENGAKALLISNRGKTKILILDLKTGKGTYLHEIGNIEAISAAALSPKEHFVLVGSRTGKINLIDLEKGTIVSELPGHKDWVAAIAFSPDGKSFLSAEIDDTIKYWDLKTEKLVFTLQEGDNKEITSIAVSPDGKYAVIGSKTNLDYGTEHKFISLWDLEKKTRVKRHFENKNEIDKIAISPGGKLLLIAGWDRDLRKHTVSLFNLETGKKIQSFTGHEKRITEASFSPDGRYALSGSSDGMIIVWNIINGDRVKTFLHHGSSITGTGFTKDGKTVISSSSSWTNNASIRIWDPLSSGALKILSGGSSPVQAAAISRDGENALSGFSNKTIKLWDLKQGMLSQNLTGHSSPVRALQFSPTGKTGISGSEDGVLNVWDLNSGKKIRTIKTVSPYQTAADLSSKGEHLIKIGSNSSREFELVNIIDNRVIKTFTGHQGNILSLSYGGNDNFAVSGSMDGTMRIWNLQTAEWVAFMANKDGTEWLIFDSEGYWDSSPSGGYRIAMVKGLNCWHIDQFAARNNRPDLILKKLPNAEEKLIEYYYIQHLRRLYQLGLNEKTVSDDYHVPTVHITESRKDGKHMELSFSLKDSQVPLMSYNIYINDVPLFGSYGKKINDGNSPKELQLREIIELTAGENKIEISCINQNGAESYRPVLYETYDLSTNRNLYYIGFGVSEYRNSSLNLRYAHKDADDLRRMFESLKGRYQNVITRVFTNEEVTRENIAGVKKLLENASVDDSVVLMISGHGVHDRDEYATYYFLTHETDLEDLSGTAVRFEALEELLQGIPPRQKLFLMDTCGSGEWEPDMLQKVVSADSKSKGVWARVPEESAVTIPSDLQDEFSSSNKEIRTYLTDKNRYIYNDLLRRSGSIVFSSCRGDEVSYETSKYTNGIFTEYILRAFTPAKDAGKVQAGDLNGDGRVSTQELQKYVIEGVSKETTSNPLLYPMPQNPTVDRDNIYVDFGF